MPISADPGDTVPYVLKSDRDKPEDQQPRFFLRFLTHRETRQLGRLQNEHDAALKANELEKADAASNKVIHFGLTGWDRVTFRGQPIPYSPEQDVTEFLSTRELYELVRAVDSETDLKEKEKGESVSRQASGQGPSVATVAPPAV